MIYDMVNHIIALFSQDLPRTGSPPRNLGVPECKILLGVLLQCGCHSDSRLGLCFAHPVRDRDGFVTDLFLVGNSVRLLSLATTADERSLETARF